MIDSGLAGRVAIVTGAAQGIGAAVVAALSREGARVVAVDVAADRLRATVGDLRAQRLDVVAMPADVTSSSQVEAAVARAEAEFGPLDVAVSVAGILRPARVLDVVDDDWSSTFAVNVTGVLNLLRAAGSRLAARGGGSFVTVASNAAGVPRVGMAAYSASKAAAVMLTRCAGLELAASGVRCNVVSPGSTDTAMQRDLWTDADPAQAAAAVVAGSPRDYRVGIPLGRLADAADVADAVVFLASDQARHITMQDLLVDGGATLRA